MSVNLFITLLPLLEPLIPGPNTQLEITTRINNSRNCQLKPYQIIQLTRRC